MSDESAQANLERRRRLWPVTERHAKLLIKTGQDADLCEIPLEEPDKPIPRYSIGGRPVCTPGNLTTIISQSKTGKSAFVGAMEASRMAAVLGTSDRGDFLGVTSGAADPANLILHLDTEQSVYDCHRLRSRILTRAKADSLPTWYRAYTLAGRSAASLQELLEAVTWRGMLEGIHSIIIDGVADLVADVNDPEACNALVAKLHDLARKADCPIICVLHENPSNANGKGRGHLGSQLERKAESNLRLTKTDETTVVYSERMRGAPILESDGPRFAWSNAFGMHMSVESAGDTRRNAKRREAADQAAEAFAGHTQMKHGEIVSALMEVRAMSRATAERRVREWKPMEVISGPSFGQYTLNPQTTLK